jgi:hypothetical protein
VGLITLGAYKFTVRTSRSLLTTRDRNHYNFTSQQLESLIKTDIRKSIQIDSTLKIDPADEPLCSGNVCDSTIVSRITPLVGFTVDEQPAVDPKIGAIRLVMPVEGSTPVNTVTDMVDGTGNLSPLGDIVIPSWATPRFPVGTFAVITDSQRTDVFFITGVHSIGGNLALEHSATASRWNHPAGVSHAFTTRASVEPVTVVTLGVRPTDTVTLGANTWTRHSFVRKTEELPATDLNRETILGQNLSFLGATYYGMGINPDGTDPGKNMSPDPKNFQNIERMVFEFKAIVANYTKEAGQTLTPQQLANLEDHTSFAITF